MRTMIATAIVGMLISGHAGAETFACDAAKNKAKVGVGAGNEVGVTSDYKNGECRFSVNGAPVGSPPEAEIRNGLNLIKGGAIAGLLRSGDTRALSMVLLSSANESEPPPELSALLKANTKPLATCFEDFTTNKLQPGKYVISDQTILCGVLPREPTKLKLSHGDGLTVGARGKEAILVVGVARKSDATEHFLFVGRSYIQK